LGPLLGRTLLAGIQQARTRHRLGHWGRVTAASVLAAAAMREMQIRRDWNPAYKHGRLPT
jgi:hypothetical protein